MCVKPKIMKMYVYTCKSVFAKLQNAVVRENSLWLYVKLCLFLLLFEWSQNDWYRKQRKVLYLNIFFNTFN